MPIFPISLILEEDGQINPGNGSRWVRPLGDIREHARGALELARATLFAGPFEIVLEKAILRLSALPVTG